MFKVTLTIMILMVITLFGCANKKNSPQTPAAQGKPLPTECKETVENIIKWNLDRKAFSYSVSVGLRPYDFYFVHKVDGLATDVTINLDRNLTYYVRVEKQTLSSETFSRDYNFFIPSCDQRSDWKAKNPDYTEPRLDTLEF